MSDDELKRKWDARYRLATRVASPAEVLTANAHLLPKQGAALDLACGLGGNALFLASRGLDVHAWDSSVAAIEQLDRQGVQLTAEVRDVIENPPQSSSFDVIVVSHFLDRRLTASLQEALKPGGLLFYQTFSREAVTERGPSNPMYRLETNELLHLFSELTVRAYRDEGRLGDVSAGFRDLAYLVAQRPA